MSATITIKSNRWAFLSGTEELPTDVIRHALRYRPSGYEWSPAYKAGTWDGWICVYHEATGSFPVGCLSLVTRVLRKAGIKYKVKDFRKPTVKWYGHIERKLLPDITLRDDQANAVGLALRAGRGVVKFATGGGKTEMMASIIKSLGTPKTLVIVPSKNLLVETSERLSTRLGISVGKIGGKALDVQQVTVAIPSSLSSGRARVSKKGAAKRATVKYVMKSTELLLIDECHHTPATTWSKTINRIDAYWRFGMSGTPLDRNDGSGLKLIAATGPVVANIRSKDLVEKGILAKPYVEIVRIRKPVLPPLFYADAYNLGVVRNRYFHKIVVAKAVTEASLGKRVLILVNHLDHGYGIQRAFLRDPSGTKFEFVHAELGEDVITAAKKKLASGEISVLIASPVFGEGTDIPSINTLIVADGGKSVIRTVQKAGRAMRRKKEGVNECKIIDFAHETHKYLSRHSLNRIAIYESEGFEFIWS